MKKFFLLCLTLNLFTACKDVEKNPSGCDYDYVKEGNKCVNLETKAKYIVEQNNDQVHNNLILGKYVEYDNGSYEYRRDLESEMNQTENPFQSFQRDRIQLLAIKDIVKKRSSELEMIQDRGYSNTAWNEVNKLSYIESKLDTLTTARGDLAEILQLDETEQDKAFIFLDELRELMDDGIGRDEMSLDFDHYYSNGLSIKIDSAYTYNTEALRENIVKALSEKSECSNSLEDCIESLKDEGVLYTPDLYTQILDGLDISYL